MTAVFYISGHGYGHAIRSGAVIREWLRLAPETALRVRTTAPAWLLGGLPVAVEPARIDAGMLERDGGLNVDAAGTVAAVRRLIAAGPAIVAREAAAVRGAGLVVADVPWLAAEIAETLGVPSVAVSNFTWDWIYQPFMPDVEPIRAAYGRFSRFLRVPLGQPCWDHCSNVEDVPLIVRPLTRGRDATLRALGVHPSDRRIRVMVAMRGGLPATVAGEAARAAPECLFLTPAPDTPFQDVLAAADVVIAKIGYGIVAECMAAGTRLLYPPRLGFREVEEARRQALPYLPMLEIPRADFDRGAWRESILALAAMPVPARRPPADGAARAARILRGILM